MPPGISSQIELPVSRRVWIAKVGLVVALDVALAAAGVGLMVAARSGNASSPSQSSAAAPQPTPPGPTPTVEVAQPKVVRKGRRKPTTTAPVATLATPTPTPTPAIPTPAIPTPEARPPDAAPASPESGPGTITDPNPAATDPPAPAGSPDAAPPPPDDGRADRIADSIREVVEDHRAQIDRCYERVAKAATRTDPLRGTVTVSLTLQPTGSASDVKVAENDTGSDDLGACLVSLLEGWKFPTPGDEAIEFLWPFVFRGH